MSVDILLVGGGGRESALAWKIAQSPLLGRLFIAPGNAGTARIGENVAISAHDIPQLLSFAEEKSIHLTVVGPDDPLALGIVDAFRARGLNAFGPSQAAARIEYSKAFAKEVMREAGVPTAAYGTFTSFGEARAFVLEKGAPIVVKASGLALGKGVSVCMTLEEAERALREIMIEKIHKDAGNEVVIEEYLEGREISLHAISDGATHLLFPPAQDHKRARDGDAGKNTGGMGTIAPLPFVSEEDLSAAYGSVILPTLRELEKRNIRFSGVLFPGLMMTKDGPKVLEFNARFGDPETQAYMRLLESDLVEILLACATGNLHGKTLAWRKGFAANIVLASDGYPDNYKKGIAIQGIETAEEREGVVVFHAGTVRDGSGIRTSGGRVLGVSATGDTLEQALERAYGAADIIQFEGKHMRRDIGAKAVS